MASTSGVKYATRAVKTVRGMAARTTAKMEKEGWEFVSLTQGTVRSEMIFRRPKPGIKWKPIGIGGGLPALLVIVPRPLSMGLVAGMVEAARPRAGRRQLRLRL
ncbi:hypothetical protein [Arthrobacter sp. SDTb3-6]|uniref:hypothetical protein n=1 Tax=Arthrobacter sp. SDTb3-6 TaxID=2713571 RepID=UPI00159E3653|nr:hypothetical protein [Arthrobacter sp. SDTb3-6]NVM98137.1 hypothetical protein [Arthrobacter sp. SDTb3-6]